LASLRCADFHVLGPSGIGYSYWTYNHDFSNGEGGGTEVGYFYQHSMQDLAELMKSMREVLLAIFPGEVIYRSNVPGAKGKDTWVENWDEEGGCALHRGPIAECQKPPFPVLW
jgi:hypothetical protein